MKKIEEYDEMYTNKYVKIKGKRYYCDKNGVMKAKYKG